MGKDASDDIITTSSKWASMECQQFLVLHPGQSEGYGKVLTHNRLIGYLYGQKCYWRYRIHLLQLSAHRVSTIFVGAQQATQQWTASHCNRIESYAVSLSNMSLYSTSQICMQCPTDLIFLLVAVESIFKDPRSALLYRYRRQAFESDYPDFKFLRSCLIQNL